MYPCFFFKKRGSPCRGEEPKNEKKKFYFRRVAPSSSSSQFRRVVKVVKWGFLFVFIPPAVEASTAPFSSPVSPLFSLLPAGSRRQLELVSRGLKRSAGTAGMGV